MCYPSNVKETAGTDLLFSPLALAYLARHTPDHYDITLYDEYVGEDIDPEKVDADIVAVSSLSSAISRAYDIGDRLRKRGIKTVIGGAHVSALPYEALEHFDTVIIGEGEGPWRQYLSDYEKNDLKNTYFGAMDVSLDNIQTPRRDLIHPNYHYQSVMTSRGCPYSCSFCYLSLYKKRKYRTIPHETVLKDLDSLQGEEILIITDENFIGYSEADIADRTALLKKMTERNYRFVWGCQTSVNIAEHQELLKLMFRAGCRIVFIGFESADQESLVQLNKRHNIGINYKEVINRVHHEKIAVVASFILGMDNQSNVYHKHAIKELKKIKADFVRVFYMTAWPGTRLFKELERQNRINYNWDIFRQDVPSVQFRNYTHQEAIEARKEILDSFFNWRNLTLLVFKWLFRERSLIKAFIKMIFRTRIAEKIKYGRAKKLLSENRAETSYQLH